MDKWQNPLLTLGERCVAFAENEMANGVKEEPDSGIHVPELGTRYFNTKHPTVNSQKKEKRGSKI